VPGGGSRPATAHVAGQGLADVDGQREPVGLIGLADHQQHARPPVDVIQRDADDLPGLQAQPCQQQQDGVVPAACRAVAVAGGQQGRDLAGADPRAAAI
jgi:hypothetical protein